MCNLKKIFYRLSNNSRVDHSSSYQAIEVNETTKESQRVNTPANVSNAKPVYNTSSQEAANCNDRMVSPKRKVEHFPQLYVANNVKTATFNEQTDKSNKNNLMNNEYNKYCPHTLISMVPERDTGPLTSVGSLRLPACQNLSNSSKYNGDVKNEEHRVISGRPHHHVSVQELRLQQRAQCNSSSDENRSSGHASMSDTGNSSPRATNNVTNDRLTAGIVQKPVRNRVNSQHNRARHRATPARVRLLRDLITEICYL